MKRMLPLIVIAALVAAVGCQKKASDQSQVRSDVTDISPLANGPSPSPAYGSDIPAPTYTPSYTPAVTTTPAPTAPATTGTSYTIRRGDTFYSLARTHYGDGKAWQKIASANPGVDPHNLRIAQSITLP